MNLLIRNGRIIDPLKGIDQVGDLLVIGGKIAEVGAGFKPAPTIVDATGLIVSPGFIDLHCHLRQPGFEEKETIASGTGAAARGGFTTVCCMPNTNPPIDKPEVVGQIRETTIKAAVVRVLPIGCVTVGRSGVKLTRMSQMKAAGVIAFSDDGSPVADSDIMRQALETVKTLGVPIIDHCEDPTLAKDGVMNEGALSVRLGYRGIPAAAEERMVARDIQLARETGGHVHIAHVSTKGSVDLIRRAKKEGIPVTAEVTPHHLTLTEEAVLAHGAQAKVNPPLRAQSDVDALILGLGEGIIDAIATDHAPHTIEDKTGNFARCAFGISGFETALGGLMTLVHSGKMDLTTLISRLTLGPARILNLLNLSGSLQVGAAADITIFDPNAEWTVDPEKFASKGKNTPLAGAKLKGKVLLTVFEGRIVYRDESCHLLLNQAI
ncbi:MAG: dihydroorotase [Dehalococcoidia bacterium]|nr:dihydroorotase [Dehalococcoidia bacterium]